jgi:hypothetical protein
VIVAVAFCIMGFIGLAVLLASAFGGGPMGNQPLEPKQTQLAGTVITISLVLAAVLGGLGWMVLSKP